MLPVPDSTATKLLPDASDVTDCHLASVLADVMLQLTPPLTDVQIPPFGPGAAAATSFIPELSEATDSQKAANDWVHFIQATPKSCE